ARAWAEFCRAANLWHAKKESLSSAVIALKETMQLQVENVRGIDDKRIGNAILKTEETLRNYNFMNASVFDLLMCKDEELAVRRERTRMKMQAWKTYAELLHAAGGAL